MLTNTELNLIKEKQALIQEYAYLEKEGKRLETVIDAQAMRQEIEVRKKEINEKLLEINISLLKESNYEQSTKD